MELETNLERIAQLGKQKDKENFKFRSYLKGLDIDENKLDKIVHNLNKEVSEKIDCTECANCCKIFTIYLSEDDISIFAKGLNTSSEELIKNYCKNFKDNYDEDDLKKYEFSQVPCPFLENNKCTNYEHRPKECQQYPYLQKDKFISRLLGVIDNYSVCPIVFNVYEQLKKILWTRNWRTNVKIELLP